jgi:biotin transport system permease protein
MAGLGVALVFRALPLLRADLHRAHEAVHARGGGARPVYVRMRAVAVVGVRRTLTRADRLGTAMTARCLSWNPTLPALSFGRLDAVALALGFGLVAVAVASGW